MSGVRSSTGIGVAPESAGIGTSGKVMTITGMTTMGGG